MPNSTTCNYYVITNAQTGWETRFDKTVAQNPSGSQKDQLARRAATITQHQCRTARPACAVRLVSTRSRASAGTNQSMTRAGLPLISSRRNDFSRRFFAPYPGAPTVIIQSNISRPPRHGRTQQNRTQHDTTRLPAYAFWQVAPQKSDQQPQKSQTRTCSTSRYNPLLFFQGAFRRQQTSAPGGSST